MSVLIEFRPKSFSTKQYDEVVKRLERAGAENPRGRTYHACYKSGNSVNMFDVWESSKDYEKFGQTLNPILKELKLDVGRPEIREIHNIVEEQHAHTY
jgi:hypothetical protein